MKHAIDPTAHGPAGAAMAEAVSTCVHCGFCLPDCPTYRELGQEMDSPRGRIVLMKEVLEGAIPASAAEEHVDRCLGCLACETTCPSGVRYGELISPYRDLLESRRKRGPLEKLRRKVLSETLPSPKRMRTALLLAKLARPLRGLLPAKLRAPLDLLPDRVSKLEPLPEVNPARGEQRARVALLAGCAQQVIGPGINRATVDLLTSNGVEVVVPPGQACCGALAWHIGDGERARIHARHNLTAFEGEFDAVITNAAGCGSGLRDYPMMLAGGDEEDAARAFAGRVRDISSFLGELDLAKPPRARRRITIAYHDACHLLHAQGVRQPPRDLLASIPNVELIDLPDENVCCGSAGSYNLDQPEIAARLGEAKARLIIDSGAELIATGNIGCLTQLQSHLRRKGRNIPVRHTVEILADAYARRL